MFITKPKYLQKNWVKVAIWKKNAKTTINLSASSYNGTMIKQLQSQKLFFCNYIAIKLKSPFLLIIRLIIQLTDTSCFPALCISISPVITSANIADCRLYLIQSWLYLIRHNYTWVRRDSTWVRIDYTWLDMNIPGQTYLYLSQAWLYLSQTIFYLSQTWFYLVRHEFTWSDITIPEFRSQIN